ncbi:MAG: TetR/AcrR family transcriptional regulator [Desulfitobacteriaceae bacterium]|nr:TetR/AcrR family transcriptional regulator [Desulfitobacteriaceae bacterium]
MIPKTIKDPMVLIQNQARDILYNEGYKDFSIRKIAKASGVSVGTIYNYFSTKEELLVCLMMEYWEKYYDGLEQIDREEKGIFVKIQRMSEELNAFVRTFQQVWLDFNEKGISKSIQQNRQEEKNYFTRLICKVEKMLSREPTILQRLNDLNLDVNEIAHLIVMNLVMIAQFKNNVEYKSFEKVLRAILE